MFTQCPCDHCGEHIEFSVDDFEESSRDDGQIFGQSIPCPHCGKVTVLFIPGVPPVVPKFWRRWKRRTWIIAAALCIGAGAEVSVILLLRRFGFEGVADKVDQLGNVLERVILYSAGAVLALFWMLFPVLIFMQLRQANKTLQKIERNTEVVALAAVPFGNAPAPAEPRGETISKRVV